MHMTNRYRRAAVTATLLACLWAQAAEPAPSAQNQARAEMMSVLADSAARWNAGDLKGHLAIYDESVTVMTKTGPRPTVAAIEAAFGAAYFKDGKPKQTLGFDQTTVRMLSSDSALMTGRFALTGNGLPTQSGWFTLVWLRTAQGWRVVHDHTC